MEKVLAIDFDGVICDSRDECLITAYISYQSLLGKKKELVNLEDFDRDFVSRFRKLRYLVRHANDFWLLIHLLLAGTERIELSEFNTLKEKHRDVLTKYKPVFYETRNYFRSLDIERWTNLHRPYSEFQTGWIAIREGFKVYVVTSKDLASVQHFSKLWNLEIATEKIWSNEKQSSKAQAVHNIMEESNVSSNQLFFIDDHPDNLIDVMKTGATCFWATWGYTPADYTFTGNVRKLNNLVELLGYVTANSEGIIE